jgi:hypothetical protein
MLEPLIFFWKDSNAITTTVTLSKDLLRRAFLITYSTPMPIYLCTLIIGWDDSRLLSRFTSRTLIQTHSETSSFESLSKIPSLPITIKSHSSLGGLSILKKSISGIAITTFGFPPRAEILASRSPKVLLTESLPGRTL